MLSFKWKKVFELQVPEIDGDHRTIMAMMKAVETAAVSGDRERCLSYLDRLLDFIAEHFRREENLLRRWGYGGTERHAEYHDELYSAAITMKNACSDNQSSEEFEDCCYEMMSFLIDDIIRGGLALKSFLQDAKLTMSI